MISKLLARVLALALLAALLLAGWQWRQALLAQAETERVRGEFAQYRETQERQAREALQVAAVTKARSDKIRQEAIDAEYLARVAAEADAARLRASSGQLQRYAQDLATSLGDRARDTAAADGGEATRAAANLLANVLDRLDEAAGGVVQFADQSRLAGQLCERTYQALTPP